MTLVVSRLFLFSLYFFEGVALLKARRGKKLARSLRLLHAVAFLVLQNTRLKGNTDSSGLACGSDLVLSHLACPA